MNKRQKKKRLKKLRGRVARMMLFTLTNDPTFMKGFTEDELRKFYTDVERENLKNP